MGIFFGWIIFSFVVGYVGSTRKIGFWGAFLLSLLLSPIIGIIIAFASKSIEDEAFKAKVLSIQQNQLDSLNKLSIVDQLEKLKKLREEHLITDEEFLNLKNIIFNSNNELSRQTVSKNFLDSLTEYEKNVISNLHGGGLKKGEKILLNEKTRKIIKVDKDEWILKYNKNNQWNVIELFEK